MFHLLQCSNDFLCNYLSSFTYVRINYHVPENTLLLMILLKVNFCGKDMWLHTNMQSPTCGQTPADILSHNP